MRIYLVLVLLGSASAQPYVPPSHIRVQPVIIVPSMSTAPAPTVDDQLKLYYQVQDAKDAYFGLLHQRDTFDIAGFPLVVEDPDHTVSEYATNNGQLAALKAMEYFGNQDQGAPYNRYTNPYIYLVLAWGVGNQPNDNSTYGTPMNGGVNSGGGIAVIKWYPFWTEGAPPGSEDKLQSTIQHELGHTFGLPHTFPNYADPNSNNRFNWCLGTSIMSYNTKHWTNARTPAHSLWLDRHYTDMSKIPTTCDYLGWGVDGILLAEEINLLAMNKRVFPLLYFDPEVDMPYGYDFQSSIALNNELGIDVSWNSPEYEIPWDYAPSNSLQVYTWDGESSGTSASHTIGSHPVGYVIKRPSDGFDQDHMWRSGNATVGNTVSLRLNFAAQTTLSGVVVHTGYGPFAAEVSDYVCVTDSDTNVQLGCSWVGADDTVTFPAHSSYDFSISFHAKVGSVVTVRGVQLLTPGGEIFPHRKRTEMVSQPLVTTSSGETYSSRVAHVVGPTITPNTAAAGYDGTTMWHSAQSTNWDSLLVTFAYPVTLDAVDVHSQHSGRYHAASRVQVDYLNPNTGLYSPLVQKATAPDDTLSFANTKAATWRIWFLPSDGWVTIRGLRFYTPASLYNIKYRDNPDSLLPH